MSAKSYSLMLLLCTALSALKAQTKLPENIFRKKLANGLTVMVIEDNSVPLATVSIAFKNGSFTQTAGLQGVTGLYHSMLMKSNAVYGSGNQPAFYSARMGIKRDFFVSEEVAESFATMPSLNVDLGMRFMNATIRSPKFDENSLDDIKKQVDADLQTKENNPAFWLGQEMNKHLWGDFFMRKSAVGTHQSIQSATLAQMDTIQKKYYYPNNALLIIAGNVSHEQMFAKAQEIFGDWEPSGFDPFKKWPIPEVKPINKTQYFTVENINAKVPYIMIEWQGPSSVSDKASTYAADVFSYILTQNSSKLKKALVQSGLALDLTFSYLTLNHVGPITFLIRPNPAKLQECLAEVKRQINLFDTRDYVTAEQIETAQRKLEIGLTRREEISSDFSHTLAFWWSSASIDYYFTYLDNLQKVKATDLQSYVRKYIKNKPYCAGLLISPELRGQLKTNEFFKADN